MDTIAKRIHNLNSENAAKRFVAWFAENESVSFDDLMCFVYGELTQSGDRKYVFIKENNIHEMLFFLLQYFPDAKFVFQVRDPRDYLLSALQLRDKALGNKFGSNMRAMENWRNDQIGGLRALAHLGKDRVFFQRYEDLVSNPAVVLEALCRFLDLDYQDAMLSFHESQMANRLAKPGGPRANLNKPLLSENFSKYKTQLPRELIIMVEAYLGDLMNRFGYDKDFPEEKYHLQQILYPQIMESIERFANDQNSPFYTASKMESDAGDQLQVDYLL